MYDMPTRCVRTAHWPRTWCKSPLCGVGAFLDDLRDERKAKSWLFCILRREHARQYERFQPPLDELHPEQIAAHPRDETPDIEVLLLRRAIRELPLKYREPLALQVVGGYNGEEIARFWSCRAPPWTHACSGHDTGCAKSCLTMKNRLKSTKRKTTMNCLEFRRTHSDGPGLADPGASSSTRASVSPVARICCGPASSNSALRGRDAGRPFHKT